MDDSGKIYDADYYLNGLSSGKSLYENYRYIPELTGPMAEAILTHLGHYDVADSGNSLLDFGCARGYLVRCLRELGHNAKGVDVSQWAIENCDETVKDHVSLIGEYFDLPDVDWIIAKDVLEHVPKLMYTIKKIMDAASCGVFVVVPLSRTRGNPYVVSDYEKDVTHIHRMNLLEWGELFVAPGWKVELSYRVPGVKDSYASHAVGNGFVTARRIK